MIGSGSVSWIIILIFLPLIVIAADDPLKAYAMEKVYTTKQSLDFIKKYCFVTRDYDSLIFCRCQAKYMCTRKAFKLCLSRLDSVFGRIVNYMFVHCTGNPPINDKLSNIAKQPPKSRSLKPKPSGTRIMKCNCKFWGPLKPS